MSNIMGVQLTSGQRCLLDLLQRKLLNTIQSYAKLGLEKQELGPSDNLDMEMLRLKDKIRRISARQKRFTMEIINGNGNNTIPKESFFEALGLVTKEALNKLNSKSNERRRRTTANPRFSHEAIQAKRALEPINKRLEPRVTRDRRETSKRPQRQQTNGSNCNSAETGLNSSQASSKNANRSNITRNSNSRNGNPELNSSGRASNQQASCATTRTGNRSSAAARNNSNLTSNNNSNVNDNNNIISCDDATSASVGQKDLELLHHKNAELRQLALKLREEYTTRLNEVHAGEKWVELSQKKNMGILRLGMELIQKVDDPQFRRRERMNLTKAGTYQEDRSTTATEEPAIDSSELWVDMKCDESLDGLD